MQKKTIESVSMLIPSAHTSLGFFSPCSKPICLAQRSPKTDFVFTPNSISCIVSHLSDHLDQASHLKIGEFMPSFTRVVLLKFCLKPYKIRFRASKLQYWFKSDSDFVNCVDFAYRWSIISGSRACNQRGSLTSLLTNGVGYNRAH